MSPMLVTLPPSLRKTGLIPAFMATNWDANRRAEVALTTNSPGESIAGITSVPAAPPPARNFHAVPPWAAVISAAAGRRTIADALATFHMASAMPSI